MGSVRRKPDNRKGRVYEARYRDKSGRQHSRTFHKKQEADAWLADQSVKHESGEWIDPARGKTLFASYAEEWLEALPETSSGTRLNIEGRLRNHILPTFATAPLVAIQPAHIQKWVKHLQAKGLAPATINPAYRLLARILRRAVIEGCIAKSPCIEIQLPSERNREEMKVLTPQQVRTLAETIDQRYRVLIFTAAYTGMRWGELAALRRDNVRLDERTITVTESLSEVNGTIEVGPTKTNKPRKISLPNFLKTMLAEHMIAFPSEQGFVFSSSEGKPLRRNFYRRHFLKAVEAAGVGPLRFHDLRHTCASLLIAQGAHPKEIQERLGHSTIRLTFDRYGHLLPTLDDRLREGLDTMYEEAR